MRTVIHVLPPQRCAESNVGRQWLMAPYLPSQENILPLPPGLLIEHRISLREVQHSSFYRR